MRCIQVLVADDDKFYRDRVKEKLIDLGYEVTTVSGGSDAVKEVMKKKVYCIMLDIHMEGPNIHQVIPMIKGISPDLPIIAVSSDDSIETEKKVRALGIFYYLLKPFDAKELEQAIEGAVKALDKGKRV